MRKIKDYTGITKNNLTAIKFIRQELGRQFWEFQCTCGTTKVYRVDRVLSCKYRETKCNCNSKSDMPTRKALFRKYIKGAKERNYIFDLNFLTFNKLISDNCNYCGSKPIRIQKSYYRNNLDFVCNGIDRKNNEYGYTIENSVSCCYICNRAKNNLDYEVFISWIKQIKTSNEIKL